MTSEPGLEYVFATLSIRVDKEFDAALRELRRLYEDVPTKSRAVRRAVFNELERLRKERRK